MPGEAEAAEDPDDRAVLADAPALAAVRMRQARGRQLLGRLPGSLRGGASGHRLRELPPDKREAIRNARQWFRSLPPEERRDMRQQWKNMSPEERQTYRRELRRRFGDGQGAPSGSPRPHDRPFQNHPVRPGH